MCLHTDVSASGLGDGSSLPRETTVSKPVLAGAGWRVGSEEVVSTFPSCSPLFQSYVSETSQPAGSCTLEREKMGYVYGGSSRETYSQREQDSHNPTELPSGLWGLNQHQLVEQGEAR